MPITAQDKQQILIDAGIDPDKYWIDDAGEVIEMAKQGAVESGIKSALYNAPRSALGFVGAAAGTAGAGALAIPSGPGAFAAGAAGGLAGGAAGASIGDKIQSALYPAGWQFAEEARSVRDPKAVYTGQIASQLATMRPSPRMLSQVFKTAPGEFIRSAGQVSPASRAALLNIAGGAGLGGGVELARGGDAGDVLRESLVGALLHQPTKLGQVMSRDVFHPWSPAPTAAESTGGMTEAFQAKLRGINEARARMAQEAAAAKRAAFDEAAARGEAPMPVEDAPAAEPYEGSGVEKELGVAPSEEWNTFWRDFAPRMKAKFGITDEPILTADGERAAGEMAPRKSAADEASIKLSSGARADTAPHENLHLLIDDVLNYGTPRERAFMEQALQQLGLDVAEAGGKRAVRGNLEELVGPREGGALRSEEELVQTLGEDVVRRAVKPEEFDTTRQALRDFTEYYLKNRMTPESARRLLSGRLMYGRGTAPSVNAAAGKAAAAQAAANRDEQAAANAKVEAEAEALATEQARKHELDMAEAEQLRAQNDERAQRIEQLRSELAKPSAPKPAGEAMPTDEGAPIPQDEGGYEPSMARPQYEQPADPTIRKGDMNNVDRPEKIDYAGASIPANIKRGRAMRENAAESPEDLELRRIEDRLSGRDRSKYQTFMSDFEKELAQPRPFKIQVAKDGRMAARDVLTAVAKLNPTEQEMIKSAGLEDYLRTVVRPNAAELKAWAEENVPRVEVKELGADRQQNTAEFAEMKANALKHELDTSYSDGILKVRRLENSGVRTEDAIDQVAVEYGERAHNFKHLMRKFEKALAESEAAQRNDTQNDNDSATRRFDTANVNPRKLADMPGAVDLLVRLPTRELTADRAANLMRKQAEGTLTKEEARELSMLPKRGERGYVNDPSLYKSSHYPQSGDNLLAHLRAYEHTMPNGERVLRVFELQSDWAQDRRKAENRYTVKQFNDGWGLVGKDGELTTYTFGASSSRPKRFDTKEQAEAKRQEIIDETANHPLLPHHQRLALKAAIEHARKRGIKRVVVDDAETAMMTEGHDKYAPAIIEPTPENIKAMEAAEDYAAVRKLKSGESIRVSVGELQDLKGFGVQAKQTVPQERGMRLAYDNVLQQMMRDLSGEGVKVELGIHRNAFTERTGIDDSRVTPRPDLIFRNPDGTPKTQSTGYAYDVSAAQARRDAGEPFSYAGRKYQPMREEQIQSPEFKKWFGDSVVRDETGKPKMVYHGSRSPGFNEFRTNKSGYTYGQGAYFTPEPRRASEYSGAREYVIDYDKNGDPIYGYPEGEAGGTYAVYLSLKKPFVTSSDAGVSDIGYNLRTTNPKLYNELRNEIAAKNNYSSPETVGTAEIGNSYLRKQGYDGVIKEWRKGDPLEYVVFDPNQIKSATGNRGTFDPANPDIRYQPLGPDEGSYKGAKLPAREQPRRGIFAGNVEALRRSGNPDKQYFAGRADELFARVRNYVGKYEGEILKPLLELSEADQKALVGLLYDEDASGSPITPAARLRPAYKAIRAGLKMMADDQIAAGQLIDGKPRGVDPTYFPNVVDPTVLHDLTYNSGSKRAAELERQYIDYNTERYVKDKGIPRVKAAELARESFDSFRGALKPMSIEGGFDFGAVTMREGGKLPPTWVSADPVAGFRNYIKRFARSRAFYDVMQRDERAMAALGAKNYYDAAGREVPVTAVSDNLARDPNARALMESAIGVTHESQEGITPAIGRLANSLLLSNVMTRVTDVATTPFKALAYLPASEIPGLIGHLGNIRKSMENAYRTGGVRRGDMMVLRDVLGAGDRFVRGSDKLAEQIVKWTGSEALEKGARFLAQNVGEYVYDVNKTLAGRGDKRALEFLNRLTPEWRTLDRAEVAQRIAQLFQGRYDATNLPIWIANSPAAPFFSMMKWNIEQWNNFKRFAWQPAVGGDPVPLIKTLVGGAIGGAIVGELREEISGKKQRVATMEELRFGFDKGDQSRAALEAMRKAAFIAQVTGTLGIVGELGLQALDIGAKDKPQGFSWPAVEMAAGTVAKLQNAVAAVADKPQDAGMILTNMAHDLAKDNFSQYRIAMNTLDRAGVDTGAAGGADQVEESNRRRDLRMSNKLRGEKTAFSPFIEADYASTKERRMDKTGDMAEARELGSELKKEARAETKTPDEYRSALNKLRSSRIVGIPSKENNPAQYRAHVQFVLETQGEDAAARLRETYARLRREQKRKAAQFK